jgi:ABC-type branched-subunit amino acid transport system ATPase component
VLRELRREYDMTLVVIEHDLPMLSSVCDRMVALEVGKVVAEGPPLEVQRNPRVIEAYMGTDEAAISRSGQLATS